MTYAAAAFGTHDARLLVAVLVAIAVVVVLITWLKLHPAISLILGSAALALVAGSGLLPAVDSFSMGFGETTANVGLLLALGAILGKLVADSGGADAIVDKIAGATGPRRIPWAMALIAALVGLPMFFEIGLVLLIPVVLLAARRLNVSVLAAGIPALAGLSVLHGLVPPHPGPLIAIDAVKADLGITLGLGLLVAVPTVIVAGPVFGSFVAKRIRPEPPAALVEQFSRQAGEGGPDDRRPGFGRALTCVLLPVVLMLLKALADILIADEKQPLRMFLDLIGTPLVALLIAVLVAMVLLGVLAGLDRRRLADTAAASLGPIAGILLIVGAGGGFKQVLVDAKVGDVVQQLATGAHVPVLLLGWLVAVGIRLGTGSATVATVTGAGIVAPLASSLDPVHASLLALAVGAGSLFFSHVNDAGFWLVKEYFGMTVGETIRSWSVMETIISVVSFLLIALLGAVLP